MPVSRILTHESLHPSDAAPRRAAALGFGTSKASLALGTVALATAITLLGAPAAEALGLL